MGRPSLAEPRHGGRHFGTTTKGPIHAPGRPRDTEREHEQLGCVTSRRMARTAGYEQTSAFRTVRAFALDCVLVIEVERHTAGDLFQSGNTAPRATISRISLSG